MYVSIYIYIFIYIYIHVYTYIQTDVSIYIYKYIYICIHRYVYIYIQILLTKHYHLRYRFEVVEANRAAHEPAFDPLDHTPHGHTPACWLHPLPHPPFPPSPLHSVQAHCYHHLPPEFPRKIWWDSLWILPEGNFVPPVRVWSDVFRCVISLNQMCGKIYSWMWMIHVSVKALWRAYIHASMRAHIYLYTRMYASLHTKYMLANIVI